MPARFVPMKALVLVALPLGACVTSPAKPAATPASSPAAVAPIAEPAPAAAPLDPAAPPLEAPAEARPPQASNSPAPATPILAAEPAPAAPRPISPSDTRSYLLLGQGAQELPSGGRYHMALYVGKAGARRSFEALVSKAGGRAKAQLLRDDRAQSFVLWGDFLKLGVLRFDQPADAATVRQVFAEGLAPVMGEKALPKLSERAEAFLALIDRGLAPGEELWLSTDAMGHVRLWLGATYKEGPTDARLGRALWEGWLGRQPVSPTLKRALVDRIATLGE